MGGTQVCWSRIYYKSTIVDPRLPNQLKIDLKAPKLNFFFIFFLFHHSFTIFSQISHPQNLLIFINKS
ncbi:Uncharacterized protein TCM_039662 [Theobroma cacao]|uniref:Uncharacterized protein n=1 Tax=Theobroma cacao TaxID=3641 RepID=A0A061GSK4_THECC|nr:Uncharacterized protein TCM_039662 [Theobroma cacao]